MTTARPMRADAARNRQRLLDVTYQVFAEQGLSVPVDEIARRAGVGAGTVYRHFPSKAALYYAVIANRLTAIVDGGRALLESDDPGQALFDFLRSMVLEWGATDRGLVDAVGGLGIDLASTMPEAEDALRTLLADLLDAAQQAGVARTDVDAADIKALIVGCQAMQSYDPERAERLVPVVIDGLRAR